MLYIYFLYIIIIYITMSVINIELNFTDNIELKFRILLKVLMSVVKDHL